MSESKNLISLGFGFTGPDLEALSGAGFTVREFTEAKDMEAGVNAAASAEVVCLSNSWLRRIGKNLVARLGKCRLIVMGGSPDMLDLDEASLRGISVANCPGYSAPAVAEHAFALLLGVARRLNRRGERPPETGPEAQDEMIRLWKGVELMGKTLGIIGHGESSRLLAAIGQGFGMRVIVAKRDRPFFLTRLIKHRGVEFSGFRDMLSSSDFVVSSLPEGMGSRRFFSAESFAAMCPGSIFVNVGGLRPIDEAALAAELERGHLAGAGLDGLTPNAPPSLRCMKNVLITPRVAWNTLGSDIRFSSECARGAEAFFSGRPMNLVLDARPGN